MKYQIELTIGEIAALLDAMKSKDLSYSNQEHIDDYSSAKNKLINAIDNKLINAINAITS